MKYRLIFKRFLFFYVFIIVCYLIFRKLVNDKATLELFMAQAGLVGLLAAFFPFRWKDPAGGSGKFGIRAVLICILTGAAVSLINACYLTEVAKHGASATPGYNQLKIPCNTATADVWIYGAVAVITAPLLEEFFFRHVLLGRICALIASSRTFSQNLRHTYIFIAVAVISALFALAHKPGLLVFPIYFFSSLVYSLSYLKFGLPGAVLAHSAGNAGALIILSFN